jgi:hypothetical protein
MEEPDPLTRKRAAALLMMILAIAAVAAADPLCRAVHSAIDAVEPFIQRHSFAR